MATDRGRARCREKVAALCAAPADPFALRVAIADELRGVIGFSRWCWPLGDPVAGLATTAVGEHDYWPLLPRLLLLDQRVEEPNALPALRGAQSLGDRPARSLRWTDVLEPLGIGDEVRVPLRDRHGLWGCLDLLRDSDDGPFAAEDVALLDDLAPMLAAVARRSAAALGAGPASPAPRGGVLVLDAELAVRASTPGARAWLDALVPADLPHADAMALAPVYNVASRVLARRGGYAPSGPAAVRVRGAAGAWALIEAQELDGAAEDTVAVTLRPAAPHEILDLRLVAHDLTRRERELVALLLAGHDTRAVTERLYLSPYTVQDHLKSVFAKVGVRTRKELVATLATPA